MDLSSLKPAARSTHREKRIGRGQGSGKGGYFYQEGIKEPNQDQVINLRLVLKEDRCLCRDVYRNLALKI